MARKRRSNRDKFNWYRVDLHLHTPGSRDYLEPGISYLDILKKAEYCGLDIIAFTDHNTVAGLRALRKEVEDLMLLEQLNRIRPEEKQRLDEYRRLSEKILLLPGFEFTATLGFHVLGVFPPETTPRELDHILLNLRVPPDRLDEGSTEVGATVDVLTAYRIISEAGGLVIAAHANSNHGVAMQGFDFGGQTKIAYTQDPHLHALEVTDLEVKRRRTTASFFNGSKPEYPRRMHCIQGSDAHRLHRDSNDKNRLGVGDRVTEVFLPEPTFAALKELFLDNDFSRTRPFRPKQAPFDHVAEARQVGANIVQSFHESLTPRGGHLYNILCDVCAFANTNGGTIFVGLSDNAQSPVAGIAKPQEAVETIRNEVEKKITPPLDIGIDIYETQGKKVLQIAVPVGYDPPYVIDENKIYIRDESDTNLAVRDEIVALVKRSLELRPEAASPSSDLTPVGGIGGAIQPVTPNGVLPEPKTGVEIISVEERKGKNYYSLRDLRNGNIVHNVTRQSARKLWQYALTEHETNSVDVNRVEWQGDIGLWKKYKRGGQVRFDLLQRDADNFMRIYYGVTEDGIHGPWQKLIDSSEVQV
ncbi:MAG: putative DNA binding domain-containing protein [Anaerolineae bacterium]|nr:putative DNA binding domain-containing protein [Anaerolineae bacterium]